jgi:hypothetical protein
MGRIDKIELDE